MKLIFFILCTVLFLYSCTTEPDTLPINDNTSNPEEFLKRPRFEKPVPRPLGYVKLTWTQDENVSGYELQMSDTESLSTITKIWTLSDNYIELPAAPGVIRWFRVRSFIPEQSSRWSEILRLDSKDLQ